MTVAKTIRTSDHDTKIVFLTSADSYMNEGYNVDAISYLLKPVLLKDIIHCMDKLLFLSYNSQNISYTYKAKSSICRVPYRDILYFSSSLHHVEIHTTTDILRQYERLSTVEKFLPASFVRCHRSFIVNLEHIYSITPQEIELTNNELIPYSSTHIDKVKSLFLKYFG